MKIEPPLRYAPTKKYRSNYFRKHQIVCWPSAVHDDLFELYFPETPPPAAADDLFSVDVKYRPLKCECPDFVYGELAPLWQLSLQVIADNFDKMWRSVPKIPKRLIEPFTQMLKVDIDMGIAAKLFSNEGFWRRLVETRWPGYHNPWNSSNSWKIYFIERYFAEYIAELDPFDCDYQEVYRLAEAFAPYVFMLDVKQLSPPRWPHLAEEAPSTDSNEDIKTDYSMSMTNASVGEFMRRHLRYYPTPQCGRLVMEAVLKPLVNLTHLTLSFGYKNFRPYVDMAYAEVLEIDAQRLSAGLAACASLTSFKLSRSRLSPHNFALICEGLAEISTLVEIDFSYMDLTDQHVMFVCQLLVQKQKMKAVRLKSNQITIDGIILLAHVLLLKDCRVVILDLSLNEIGDAAGLIAASLLARTTRLRRVYLSGCNLTSQSGYHFGLVVYFSETLEVLDLSVNEFDGRAAESLAYGVNKSRTIKRLDLRETGISYVTQRDIEAICFDNAERARKKSASYELCHPLAAEPKLIQLTEDDLKDDVEEQKPVKMIDEYDERKQQIISEITEILAWSSAKIVDEEYGEDSEGQFASGLGATLDKMIKDKEREIIEKARAEAAKLEEDDQVVDDKKGKKNYYRRLSETIKGDVHRLMVLKLLRKVNKCERLEEIFGKSSEDKVKFCLKQLVKAMNRSLSSTTPPMNVMNLFQGKTFVNFILEEEKEKKERKRLIEIPVELEPKRKEVTYADDKSYDQESASSRGKPEKTSSAIFAKKQTPSLGREPSAQFSGTSVPVEDEDALFKTPCMPMDWEAEQDEPLSSSDEDTREKIRNVNLRMYPIPRVDSIEEIAEKISGDQSLAERLFRENSDEINEDWTLDTVWNGAIKTLKGKKGSDNRKRRKWEYMAYEKQKKLPPRVRYDEAEELYECYGSDSVTLSEDGQLTPEEPYPYWRTQVHHMY